MIDWPLLITQLIAIYFILSNLEDIYYPKEQGGDNDKICF
jgi:hypothetical protein